MITSMIFVVFLFVLICSAAVWAALLWCGLRWAKVSDITTRKIVLAWFVNAVLQSILSVVVGIAVPEGVTSMATEVAGLFGGIAAACFGIMFVFKTDFFQAAKAWLPTLLLIPLSIAIALASRSFFVEAFVLPTNAMAPTLVGNHLKGTCPECGATNYCSAYNPVDVLMVCENFHMAEVANPPVEEHGGDRFLVAKFLKPKRWELVVFKFPGDPSVDYVKRLVGMPGETLHIENGMVWINGEPLAFPEHLTGLSYASDFEDMPSSVELSGTKNNPAVLGDGEYFVLGDFTEQSLDSRLWETGAEGHPPYAVPEAYMKGVVTTTYWPPGRWRCFR